MIKRIYIIFLFSWTLWAQSPKLPTVKVFEIHGAHKASASEVKKWLALEVGKPFRSDELADQCRSLLKGYAGIGLPFARIDSLIYQISVDSLFAFVSLYLDEGVQLQTGALVFSGLSEQEARFTERFYSSPGKTIDAKRLQQDLEDGLVFFEKQAYPFAKFDLESVRFDTLNSKMRVNYHFKTIKGPRLVIKEVQIVGNELTKKKVILREIRIREGDLYNYERAAKIQSRLMRLGYFRRIEEPQVFLATEEEGGLLLRVEEGTSSRFDGVVGYTPGTGEEKGYFTGLIDLNFGNLFGTGRSLIAHWQKRDRASQDLLFRYREPWMAGYPVHLGVGFQQLIQDSTYINREYGLDLELPLIESLSVLAGVKNSSILPDSLGSYMLGIPQSKTALFGLGLVYDSRDDLLNPQRGIYYSTGVETGSKQNLGPKSILEQYELDRQVSNKRYFVDADFFIPTFKRQLISLSLHGRQLVSSERIIPLPDQFRLGGTKSLRGYREDQFRGSVIAWSNLEYRYLLGRHSRASVFCDFGYYESETAPGSNVGLKIGYGFGVRLETGLGIMSLDYGLAYGEKQGLMSGLLHVGLINEF